MAKRIDIAINLAAREAQRDMDALARSAEDTEAAIEGVESAGKKMAQALAAQADEIETELREAKAVADALGDALGPELSAKIGQTKVDEMAGKFRQAGIAADDVRANADELATALRRLDSVGDELDGPRAGLMRMNDEVDRTIGGVGRAGDATRSFAGNAVSEIPGVTETFGPLSEAVSQVTEGVLEGSIGIKQLVAAGGGVVAVTAAFFALQKQMERARETAVWRKEVVEGFVDSLREGEDAAAGLADRLSEAGEIMFKFGAGFDMDIVPALAQAGVSVGEFTQAATGGEEELRRFEDALRAAGIQGNELNVLMAAATEYSNQYSEAQQRAADFQAVFNDSLGAGGERSKEMGDALRGAKTDTEDLGDAADTTTREVRELTDQFLALKGALSEEQAFLNAQDGFDNVRQKAEEAYIAAAEGAEDAEQKARDYQQALIDQQLAVLALGDQIAGLPKETISRIQMLVDTGQLDEAERILANLARNRKIELEIIARGGTGYTGTGPTNQRHTGGRTWPGVNPSVQAGEMFLRDGPLSTAGRVAPRSEVAAASAGGGVSITTVIQGSVYGVDHLNRLLDERDRRLVGQLRQGRR